MGQNQSLLNIFKTQRSPLRGSSVLALPTTERPANQKVPCGASEVTTLAEGRPSSDFAAAEAPEDLFTDLYKIMKHPDDHQKQIVILEDLRRFWHQNNRDQFYRSQSWFDDDELYHENFLKIISVLILARFRRWSQFREIFIDHPGRRDEALPFKLADLIENTFLGPVDGRTFNSNQWIFCPLVITEMREIHHLDGPERERRLPYIKEPEKIGEGAASEVYVVPIAPGHLKFCSHGGTVNEKTKLVALKQLYKKGVPDKEFTNLATLRKNVSQHNRIMVNIATIASASHYYILYDVAAYDLNQFLDAADPRKLHRRDSAERGHNGSNDYKPADLIKESSHLADALDFLHSRLDGDTSELACTHNDLKPENILVFFPHNEERYPVGQWKIADFGISGVKPTRGQLSTSGQSERRLDTHLSVGPAAETHRGQRHVRAASLSLTKAHRDPGRYTAPEVVALGVVQSDARKGDIWSFGCIFSEVLAFAIGPGLVTELTDICEESYDDMRFYNESTREIKREILPWLSTISERFPKAAEEGHHWIEDCVKVISKILTPKDPQKRPMGWEIRNDLKKMHSTMRPSQRSPTPAASPDAGSEHNFQESTLFEVRRSTYSESSFLTHSPPQSPTSTFNGWPSLPQEPKPERKPRPRSESKLGPELEQPQLEVQIVSEPGSKPEIKLPRDFVDGIRGWFRSEDGATYWVWGIPSHKPECQEMWKRTAGHLKDAIFQRGHGVGAYYADPSANRSASGLVMARSLLGQWDSGSQLSATLDLETALDRLKEILGNTSNPVFGIFHGLDPDGSDQEFRSVLETLFAAQQLKLIFFTEKRSEVLEAETTKSERYNTSHCERREEPLSKLLEMS